MKIEDIKKTRKEKKRKTRKKIRNTNPVISLKTHRNKGSRSTNAPLPNQGLPRCVYFWLLAGESQFFLQPQTEILIEKQDAENYKNICAKNFLWYCRKLVHQISAYFQDNVRPSSQAQGRFEISEKGLSKIIGFVYEDTDVPLQSFSGNIENWGQISTTRLATILNISQNDFFTHGYKKIAK